MSFLAACSKVTKRVRRELYRLRGLLIRRPIAALCTLFTLSLLAYGPALSCDFVNWDDGGYVYRNPHITSGLRLRNIVWAYWELHGNISYWHPITWISHMWDVELFGMNPGPHHLTNLWIHTANGFLVTAVTFRLLRSFSIACVVGCVFMVHPLHVECVAWISERKELLANCFMLAALKLYLEYLRSGCFKTYGALLVVGTLAYMSKPSAVTLPCLLAISGIADNPSKCMKRWSLVAIVMFGIMSAMVSFSAIVAQQSIGAFIAVEELSVPIRAANGFLSIWQYAFAYFCPRKLSIFYQYHEDIAPIAVLCGICLYAGVWYCVWSYRRVDRGRLCWLWLAVNVLLLPTIGLVQVSIQARADRYMYLAIAPLTAMVCLAARDGMRRIKISGYVPIVVISLATSALVWECRNRCEIWENTGTLFGTALKVDPENWLANLNYGGFLMEKRQFRRAKAYVIKCAEERACSTAFYDAGVIAMHERQWGRALVFLGEAANDRALRTEGLSLLIGDCYKELGNRARAIAWYRAGFRSEALVADSLYKMSDLLGGLEDCAVAGDVLELTAEACERQTQNYKLLIAHARAAWRLGLHREAVSVGRNAIELMQQAASKAEAKRWADEVAQLEL